MAYSGYHLFVKDARLINEYSNSPQVTETYTEDLSLEIENLESWEIVTNLESLSVKIVPVLGTDLEVIHTYKDLNDFEIDINTETNKITISNDYPDTAIWGDFRDIFYFFGNTDSIVIEVPVELLLGDIDIETYNGTIELIDVEVGQLDIYTANGKISLDGITVNGDVTLLTSNGEINIKDVTGLYDLDASTSNGRIYIRDVEFIEYDLNSSNGSINLGNLNVTNQDGVKLFADTSNGSIILSDVYVLDVTLDTSNGDIEYYNTDLSFTVVDLDTDTSNGDVSTNVD